MKKRSIKSLFTIALAAVVMTTTAFIVDKAGDAKAADVDAKVKYHFLNVNMSSCRPYGIPAAARRQKWQWRYPPAASG